LIWQADLSPYTSAASARLYDRYWRSRLCGMFVPALERLLLARLRPGAKVLDVCCGTGLVGQAVAERGFAVTGLDLALAMLVRARVNAPSCRLVRADAAVSTCQAVFEGAFSTGNSLNVVANPVAVLRSVHDALAPGGLFCCDLLLSDFTLPPRTTETFVEEDLVAIWREEFDAVAGLVSGDQILVHREGGGWRRSDSRFSTRLFTEEEIQRALATAGFTAVRLLRAQRDLGLDLRARTFAVAERRSGT
jgi:SAM-dependent methyltransferase